VFISSVFTSAHPSKECSYASIPCLGIVDTNISGHITNMAIPGNDDSLDSMIFYNTHLSQYILEKKFSYISS
jgi:ribosomal protein S2